VAETTQLWIAIHWLRSETIQTILAVPVSIAANTSGNGQAGDNGKPPTA